MSSRFDTLPILRRWALLVPSRRRLATPDTPVVVLTGEIHGDPRFPNGAAIVTSCVLELDPAEWLARTRTSRYRLGAPSRVFLRWLRSLGHGVDSFARGIPAMDPRALTAARSGEQSSVAAAASHPALPAD